MQLSLEFWQRLLATEASSDRLETLLCNVRAGLVSPDDVQNWPNLTKTELERALRASSAVPPDLTLCEFSRPVFLRGADPGSPRIAIVGTRRASSYGKSVTERFAETFAAAGCTVVSGGAIGIDAVAHEACLKAGGRTFCVLPCGVDVAYPPRHVGLFERIAEQGALVSSFACGSPCTDHRLMARNKLVAELGQALVVVEAPENSGSLTTARYAIDHGTPVFVVPGPVTQDTFRGSHDLIRNGATLVDDPNQVLSSIGLTAGEGRLEKCLHLTGDELTVHQALGGLGRSPESIGMETGLSVSAVLTALTMLEMDGIVERTDNGYALKA